MPGARVVEYPAQRVIVVEGYEGLFGEFVESDQAACGKRVLTVYDRVELLGEQRLPFDVECVVESHWVAETYVGDAGG